MGELVGRTLRRRRAADLSAMSSIKTTAEDPRTDAGLYPDDHRRRGAHASSLVEIVGALEVDCARVMRCGDRDLAREGRCSWSEAPIGDTTDRHVCRLRRTSHARTAPMVDSYYLLAGDMQARSLGRRHGRRARRRIGIMRHLARRRSSARPTAAQRADRGGYRAVRRL